MLLGNVNIYYSLTVTKKLKSSHSIRARQPRNLNNQCPDDQKEKVKKHLSSSHNQARIKTSTEKKLIQSPL